MAAPAFTNKLIGETSPYLLQHAHNPVNWYPWGEEALNLARELDIPILVSIGYSACHWCHVMERESFEDEETAAIMNRGFINIKIDREERPDLDHIYMEAVQVMAGNGGWPLNVFLTPHAKPFYGGTYFPPQPAYNRPSWRDVLLSVERAWKSKRGEIIQQAEELTELVTRSNRVLNLAVPENTTTGNDDGLLNQIAISLLEQADFLNGGFGKPPKFPQFALLRFLLAYGHFKKNEKALQHAHFSLLKIIRGGIFDQAGGGMARYSVDEKWLVPHFEKMLYDNALLLQMLAEAYQENGNEEYRQAAWQTIHWLEREMKGKDGGYMAALDADSEGEEGKFYVWAFNELKALAGDDAKIILEYYGVTETGNFEGRNILFRNGNEEEYAAENKLDVQLLHQKIESANHQILAQRNRRIRPGEDHKIILAWNAMLVTGFIKCGFAFADDSLISKGVSLFEHLRNHYTGNETGLVHGYKNAGIPIPAFLDDYVFFAEAGLMVHEATGNMELLKFINSLIINVLEYFIDKETGMFFFTSINQKHLIARKIETFDGATPSGNSKIAGLLMRLGQINGNESWVKKGTEMIYNIQNLAQKYPVSLGNWCVELFAERLGYPEIVISGPEAGENSRKILTGFLPFRVHQWSEKGREGNLFKGRESGGNTAIYVCFRQNCHLPVKDAAEAGLLLKKMVC